MKLRAVIEKDDTGYYVAEVPALPGCVSQGRTRQEARANIRETIVGWISVMNDKAKKRWPRATLEVAI
ncbi:MAG: type II toxin-antitoxin system HicB family antitoxin [Elusimicrobia bacterium]|nr:type II toxin-antitoxin system HicB family antitoxin [Elusimicrobiota bacterium]